MLHSKISEPVTAALRRGAGLSPSRFLIYQGRDRHFVPLLPPGSARISTFASQDINLAFAQDICYPDSTHFSHSIRRFYGLKPRAIFSGSRDLAIYRSNHTGAGNSAWTQEAG
jgi:hypothetical protein